MQMGRDRAALVVYRIIKGQPQFLLVSTARKPDRLTLPGGKVGPKETAEQAAIRETAEEAGVLTDKPQALGDYLHRKQGQRYHLTQTFLARFAGSLNEFEDRKRHWLTLDELADSDLSLRSEIRKQLEQAQSAWVRLRVAS